MKILSLIILLFIPVFFKVFEVVNPIDFFSTENVNWEQSDTLATLTLDGPLYGGKEFKVMHQSSYESGRKSIVIHGSGVKIDSMSLPISDRELKNFVVNRMEKTESGFSVSYSCGGGNYLYNSKLHFSFLEEAFYLTEVDKNLYIHDKEENRVSEIKVSPPVRFGEVSIIDIETGW